MPVLRSVKEERFASAVAEGMTRAQAYKSAGFIGKDPQLRADNLCRKKEVKARIKELTGRISKRAVDRATKRLSIDKEWVLRELVDNAVQASKVRGGSSVRNRALELIGKHLGMFGMRERARLLGGDFHATPVSPRGTLNLSRLDRFGLD